MIAIPHSAPEIKKHYETIKSYIEGYDSRSVPYWVILEDERIIGIVVVGEEPIKVIEPIGTMTSVILICDYDQSANTMDQFVDLALRIAKEQNAVYSFIDLPTKYPVALTSFQKHGFNEIADSYRMSCSLADLNETEIPLRFERVEREELPDFLEKIKEFMSGSHDMLADIILSNLERMPDIFLDHFYSTEQLFWVYTDHELIGILDVCPGSYSSIANIGVSPKHRGNNFGRQIMLHALNILKDMGKEKAGLRVHVDNKVALQLYESLGFLRDASYRALIWRR